MEFTLRAKAHIPPEVSWRKLKMSWVALVPLKMDDSLFLFLFSLKSALKAVSRQSVIFSLVFSLSRQGLHSVSRMFQPHHCWVATSLVLRWLFLYYRSMYVEYCLLLLLLLFLLLPLLILLLHHTWSPGEPVPLSHADAEPDSGALLRMDMFILNQLNISVFLDFHFL